MYDYECTSCHLRREVHCRITERKDSLSCPECGGVAEQIFLRVPEVLVRFKEYEFNKAKNVRSNGRVYGRSDWQQHEDYRKAFDTQRRQVRAERRSFHSEKEGGIEYLGGMPGEMADSIGEAEGDPEVVSKDPITFLKKTGLHMGRD